ncbi:biopolymer transporter ExbD [bacterium]|nr:biopolymer transporter ExbD [Porticoccaceae bacterium]MDB4322038.1 biopolymer transporter ExbD [bacterium]MDB4077337.1 biopolymer transporter ExbD [Porticoccaceae bacterium]MDB9814702.1 biopolymer transporter ExbD [bacterium]MDB9951941.1 biopolymer transporter ExbD [Porticoccaceae bacterium]
MKFRRKSKQDNGINLTPLIDVVFLLLIFFMVTTTFTKETRLLITLPEANGEPAEETAQTLELLVNAEGNYAVNGQNLINREIKTIMAALQDASGGNVEMPLIITADAQASHQAVVIAMDAAGQLGFSRLNIATQQTQEQ